MAIANMSDDDKRSIVRAALGLIGQVYVHLPLKRAMHAINPIQRLKLLDQKSSGMTDREFHNEMLSIFLRLRDLHTNYILPEPLNRTTAFLPFRLDEFIEAGLRKYVVTLTYKNLVPDAMFVPGVIVTHWNGVPIDRAVDLNADREAGSNLAARHARGLESLTMRWLGMSLPPDEDWVDITYTTAAVPSSSQTVRFNWQVFDESADELGVGRAGGGPKGTCLGLDMRTEIERQVRSKLFRRSNVERQRDIYGKTPTLTPKKVFQEVFPRVGDVKTQSNTYGYIRIATFDVEDDQLFINEFIRLVGKLNQNGLIIDVRGNGGGLILAGERLLQCLTPKRIEPEKLHFINTPTTLEISRLAEFQPWNDSILQATETGAEFSQGFPLLPDDAYNDIGQKYQGPVVLLTDALCYSTTDIFAAGFQDHGIGTILGVAANTGAGGANVWDYGLLRQFVSGPTSPFPAIPRKADFRVAIRRTTRVRDRSGVPLEDLGVQPDELHQTTIGDVLNGHVDLIKKAGKLLRKMGSQSLKVVLFDRKKQHLDFKSKNVDRVDSYLNGVPQGSHAALPQTQSVTLSGKLKPPGTNLIELKGYRTGELVVSTRHSA